MKSQSKTRATGGKATARKTTTTGKDTKTSTGEKNTTGMLAEFFENELKDIYWAEKHLVEELETMAENATSEELQEAFNEHRTETEGQVERLEQVFEMLGKEATAKKCEAISGITKEVKEIMKDTEDDTFTRDVALIVGGQKVEHYEIATYGSLVQIARTLGHSDIADLLEETLEEEKNADSLLTQIAESHINEEANAETEEAEEE